jgi:hypothetical protein
MFRLGVISSLSFCGIKRRGMRRGHRQLAENKVTLRALE